MTTQLAMQFTYTALDPETRIVVQQRTTEIKALMRRAASDIIEIGQKLIEVRAKLQYGQFDGWIKTEFEWTRQTAYRFIQVAEQFQGCNNLLQLAPSALYLLAAPSTPEAARVEALERAEQGEAITHSTAREIVTNHQNPPTPFVPTAADYADSYGDDEPELWTEMPAPDSRVLTAVKRQQIAIITGSSESNEWYTPDHIIDLAFDVLGGIDLDPASSAIANDTVLAKTYFTIADDGFSQPWHGRVWLNPPYGKEENESETNATRWSKKLITEYEAGRVTAALLLVKAALGYNWFEDLWEAYPTCLLRKRLSFVAPSGDDSGQAKHATAILYLGSDPDQFRRVFRRVGRVVMPEDNSQ